MASSGTITGGRYGGSYGPWLTLSWTQVSQSVANNTTTLDLTLRFHWSANIQLTFNNKGGSLQGHSYTSSGSASGTSGSRVLKTQRVTITHNSNGARSVTLSGNITGLGLNWSGTRVNTMSVSGTANLNTIPRASTLSKFSFDSHLKPSTETKISYTVDRKSSGFRHHIQLRDGSHVIQTWDNVSSDGDSKVTITTGNVNSILNRMSNSTSRSLTLRVRTRSGNNGSWIGNAVSRNATIWVDSDVRPSVGAVTLSQTGNPVSNHTLQGFSKIKASFTRSAGYGATITSSSIQVRRRSGGADSQTINSNNGTTTNPVSLHGVYEARGTARDSRGRTTHTSWATITVTQYRAPTITNFSAVRNGSTPTTVNLSRRTTHTVLGTSNHLTYTIQRRQGTGAWTNVNSGATGTVTTSGATGSATSTGNSITSSYEFRLVVTDKLGGRAESIQTVSTQRVVLDVHKNEGVGVGKIHEKGVLDVDGEAFFRGDIWMNGRQPYLGFETVSIPSEDRAWHNMDNGVYYVGSNGASLGYPENWIAIHHIISPETGYMHQFAMTRNSTYVRRFNRSQDMYWQVPNMRDGYGQNSNGWWVRFENGLQICGFSYSSHLIVDVSSGGVSRTKEYFWDLPASFVNADFAVSHVVHHANRWGNARPNGNDRVEHWQWQGSNSGSRLGGRLMAVGRWKA